MRLILAAVLVMATLVGDVSFPLMIVVALAFGVFQGIALARYGDDLDWSSLPAVGYVVGLVAITAVGVWLLAAGRRSASHADDPTRPTGPPRRATT